jgi:mono/diheme cytochrome c family protein/uncharacterized membrane protein
MLMIILAIDQFFGRFHPVLVHLPIGILLLAVAFEWLSRWERYRALKAALPMTWGLGALAAAGSSVTGYLLSLSGDYAPDPLNAHMWMGFALTGLATAAYLLVIRPVDRPLLHGLRKGVPVLALLVVTLTGHLGGSLTHGSHYLTEHVPPPFRQWLGSGKAERPVITDAQEAQVYPEVIAPILADKCYGCHGSRKRKGELRLDHPEGIRKGGESGEPAVVAGQPGSSELIRRVSLPRGDDDHMPPEEKSQLTEAEIDLLHWWIEQGAAFDKKVKALEQPEAIAAHLRALESGEFATEVQEGPVLQVNLPEARLGPPDPAAVKALKEAGVVVLPVEQNSHFLSVSFISTPNPNLQHLRLLEPLADYITWMKLSDTPLGDSAMVTVAKLKHLTRLYLDHSAVTDRGLKQLTGLDHLAYLNLVGTEVTAGGIALLKDLPALEEVFLYLVSIHKKEMDRLRELMPEVRFESGDYALPVLASDTTVVTAPPR